MKPKALLSLLYILVVIFASSADELQSVSSKRFAVLSRTELAAFGECVRWTSAAAVEASAGLC